MQYTLNQLAALAGAPCDKMNSLRGTAVAMHRRGDIIPNGELTRNEKTEPAFDLAEVCVFKIGYEIGRIGFVSGSPVSQAVLTALREWSVLTPKVADYPTPLTWAMEHIRAGGDVALCIYTATIGGKIGMFAVIFDTGAPIIPRLPIVRVAVNLSDLLAHLLATASEFDRAVQ